MFGETINLNNYKIKAELLYSQCIAGQCVCMEGGACESAPDDENIIGDGRTCIKQSYIRCGGIGNCNSNDISSMHYKGIECKNNYQCEIDLCAFEQKSSEPAPDCPDGQTRFADKTTKYFYCLDNKVAETVKEIDGYELVCNGQYCDFDEARGNGCEVATTTEQACGSCTNACNEGESCKPAGLHGTYKCVCDKDGYSTCNGSCTDIANNYDNCGACGTKCGEKQICVDKNCTDCPDGMMVCNNKCIRPNDDSMHIASCAGGVMKCSDGYADCNNNPEDGCEISTASDFLNCGACGHACSDRYSDFTSNVQACIDSQCCNVHMVSGDLKGVLPCCDPTDEKYICENEANISAVCTKDVKADEKAHEFKCKKK
jgi:hypothetical protein